MARPAGPRVIKKYSNRRLYDTVDSRYVTLDELAGSIRAGAEVRVLDAASGTDITQATLAQIIIEGRGAAQFLSIPLLTQLIRMSDDALSEFLGRYLSGALELYLQARQGAQTLAPYNPFATVPFAATNALARLLAGVAPWGGPPVSHPQPVYAPTQYAHDPEPIPEPVPPPPSQPPGAPPQTHATDAAVNAVAELRRELEALKQSLQQKPARRRAR